MIKALFIKPGTGKPMVSVKTLDINNDGSIIGQVRCSPFRHMLIINTGTIATFNLQPGDLRENIIISDPNLYNYRSGTVLKMGDSLVRLTFLCEPCSKIKDKAHLRLITGQRGYLGHFLNGGSIFLNQETGLSDRVFEPIPYHPVERIKWYLTKQEEPILASELVWQIGLPPSYCRALPALLKKHNDIDQSLVIFKKNIAIT